MTPAAPVTASFFRPSEQPMFYAAACFAFGIVLERFAWRPPIWWLVAGMAAIAFAGVLMRRRPAAIALALAAFVPAGALTYAGSGLLRERSAVPRFAENPVEITAHVTKASLPEDDGAIIQRLEVETESVAGTAQRFGMRVNVYAHQEHSRSTFRYGDRLSFTARLRAPRNYGNPGAMDYRGYLQERGIVALASARVDRVARLEGAAGTRWSFIRDRMRHSLLQRLLALGDGASAVSRAEAGVLAAMILGESSLLERDTRTDFQRTGTYHVLVVSGMNIGILAFVIFALARWLGMGEYVATAATIVLSLFYAYLTDMGAPILRATLMLTLYLGARLLYRERYSLNAIGAAALILLVFAPGALLEASFQLTFLSVLVLGGVTQPLLERTTTPFVSALKHPETTGMDTSLPPKLAQLRLDLRLICERVAQLLWPGSERVREVVLRTMARAARAIVGFGELAAVTILMQIALALPMIYYFHRVALLGVPTNMIVIPLTSVLLPAGLLAALLSYLSETLAYLPAAITVASLRSISWTVAHVGGLAFADLRVPQPMLWTAWAAASVFMVTLFVMRRRTAIAGTAIAALTVAAALLVVPPPPRVRNGAVEITAVDVGQGDSILVVSPEGRTLLVDGGGPAGYMRDAGAFDVGEDVVSPYLWSRGIGRLDAIALTHAHSDHLGGLPSIVRNFRPRELWLPGNVRGDDVQELLAAAAAMGIAIRRLDASQELAFGSAQLRVLAPAASVAIGSANNDSLVIELRYGQTVALLTGDAEREAERKLAPIASDIDVLKVAHHGSATSTTAELLGVVRPEFAVISAGYRNPYGHPKPEVVQRLAAQGARVYRTDWNGAVTFYMDGKRVEAATYVGR